MTMGQIADIYQARGQLDEALRIRREGGTSRLRKARRHRSRAVTMGQIADIYQARGQLGGGPAHPQEEALPVYEKLKARRDILVCGRTSRWCCSSESGPVIRRRRSACCARHRPRPRP